MGGDTSGRVAAWPWRAILSLLPAVVRAGAASACDEAARAAANLIRLVEKLWEQESGLRTKLLEHKILKDTVAIVPFLETDVAALGQECAPPRLARCRQDRPAAGG